MKDTNSFQESLSTAIRNNDLRGVKLALKNGANYNGKIVGEDNIRALRLYPKIKTPLYLAVFKARADDTVEVLEHLQKLGADASAAIRLTFGVSPSDIISYKCPLKVFTFIHDHYPELYGNWHEEITLHKVAREGEHLKLVEMLKWGADVKILDNEERTPLMLSPSPDCSRSLIAAGVDVHAVDKNGNTAMWHISKETCQEYSQLNHEFNGEQAANLGMFAKEYGIQNDPKAIEISLGLMKIFENVDVNTIKGILGSDQEFPNFREALHQAKAVLANERMNKLEKFVKRGKSQEQVVHKTPGPKF